MFINNFKKSSKMILGTTLATIISFSSVGCGENPLAGGEFNLKTLMTTKIDKDGVDISSNLKWDTVAGAKHYEITRTEDGGEEITVGSSKVENDKTSLIDNKLKEGITYKYIISAIDSNNKLLKREESIEITPISSKDLKETTIVDLKPNPETNKITRTTDLSWSSVEGVDLYYPSITNDANSQDVFGVYTDKTTINVNETASPIKPEGLLELSLPILTGGLEKSVQHRFSVYTIKFNAATQEEATAIGIRKSEEVFILI